jgi:hypothetical protein
MCISRVQDAFLDISFTRLPLDIIKQIGKPNNFKVFELEARKTKG